MKVTGNDKIFYTSAVEYLYNKFEIAGEFVKNNGLSSVPIDKLRDMMIVSMKEWLRGKDGENWLNTIGYYKTSVSYITYSGCTTIRLDGTELCPACSGSFIAQHGLVCERCGNLMCGPCVSVVDNDYGIVWCESCMKEEGLN